MIRVLTLAALLSAASADVWKEHFSLEKIPLPTDVDPQIGGLDTLPDGKIIAAMHRGEVLIYDPVEKTWSTFAEGLHEPLGIVAEDQNTVLVMQRPELTRIRDTDGDGRADSFETVYDGFGMSGNYHEFSFGPARDVEGNVYVALGVASNGAGIRSEIRGEWNEIGQLKSREEMLQSKTWKERKSAAGRMYSRVPYRGWVIKLPANGSQPIPFASGFRSPDGIGFDADGRLLVTDNQGDWLGTSKLYHVEQGNHYGHVASLIWRDDWNGEDPLKMKPEELDALRTPAAGLFPQGELSNSPTEPFALVSEKYGPFSNATIIGEMNLPNLVRFLPDRGITSTTQGTTIPFIDGLELGRGNHRMTLGADGSLYVGKTHLSWAGAEGLVKITPKPSVFKAFALRAINATKDGFTLSFSQPLRAGSEKNFTLKRHRYNYSARYGSPKVDEVEIKPTSVILSNDGLTLDVATNELTERHLYTFDLKNLRSRSDKKLLGATAYYHLVSLPE